MPSADSPYPLGGAVTDPRLLRGRRNEISAALEAIAPMAADENRHAAVLGEPRSGRSTVLLEVARRAATDRARLVVWLRCAGGECDLQDLTRRLLTALTEALAKQTHPSSGPWYQAWRDRVYLRDCRPATERDVLTSALMLAKEPHAAIDVAVLERDLEILRDLAASVGLSGIVVCIDDASSLTEDIALIEALLGTLDTVGGYALLMAGLPTTAYHFVEAASPCLARFTPIWLDSFRGPHQIFSSLAAPLTGDESRWINEKDTSFLRDVLRLTGGNPYELMLVDHHLWLTCQRGEQGNYALTPRVLDRVIPSLALLTAGGDALLDGAQAIDRLADEHVREALEIVAMSRLTVRQIAIARILKIDSRDADCVDRAILTADIGEETARVTSQLEELQDAGVIQLHADREHFSVVGGPAASVLLKYKARARIGAEASSQPFGLNYLFAVGRALARDATLRTLAIEGGSSLGFGAIMSQDGAGCLSPRPAIRSLHTTGGIARLAQAEIDLVPWSPSQDERIAELLTMPDPLIALVYTGITHDRQQLEYTELWELPAGTTQEDLAREWSTITEEWEPVVAAADLNWNGIEFAVVGGDVARRTLVVLQRYAAISAVHLLFERWYNDGDAEALLRAQQIGDETITTLRAIDMLTLNSMESSVRC